MAAAWVEKLKSAEKTCIIQDGRRKIHFSFSDGIEFTEEYDLNTGDLSVRKWRKKGTLGGQGKWDTEVGDESPLRNLEVEGMMESSSNPVFVRKDTKTHFQWRVRNLPYPVNNYNVTLDKEKRQLVIRTENKKYFKRFNIPDMDRMHLELKQDQISIAHANNTLIVSYKKSAEVKSVEKQLQDEFKKMKASKDETGKVKQRGRGDGHRPHNAGPREMKSLMLRSPTTRRDGEGKASEGEEMGTALTMLAQEK